MNKSTFSNLILVSAAILLLCGAAWSQNISGREGETSSYSLTFQKNRAVPEIGLPAPKQPGCLVKSEWESRVIEKVAPEPIWKQLDNLGTSDKKNALICIEGPANPDPTLLRECAAVESLWNSGSHDDAVKRLQGLEQSCGFCLAVGISWRKPKPTTGGKWGGDIQIGAQSGIKESALDFDYETGNSFAVLLRDGGTRPCWTMNFSPDGGYTWFETYQWSNYSGDVLDIGAAVVDDYCYVGYAPQQMFSGYPFGNIRRFSVLDGTSDDVYSYQSVIDLGEDIREIDLVSNTDSDRIDNRIYYFALMEDSKIQFYWANEEGMNWASFGPAASGASHSLEAAYNQGYVHNYLVVCYADTSGMINVAHLNSSGWSIIPVGPGDDPSIGAWGDMVFVAYELYEGKVRKIQYAFSWDAHINFDIGTLADTGYNYSPSVTLRRGQNPHVIWQEELGAFDYCWFTKKLYAGVWSTPEYINEVDVITGSQMSIEQLRAAYNYDCGMIWIDGESGSSHAMFDREDSGTPLPFYLVIDPDPLVSGSDATFYVSGSTPNENTYLLYSLTWSGGSFYFPPLDITIFLDNPRQAGPPIVTDSYGNGHWTLNVPPQAAGRDVWFGAVQYQNTTPVVPVSVQ